MTTRGTPLEYQAGDTLCKGEYFVPAAAGDKHPVVLVVHAWDGLNDEVRGKAEKLANAGYIAFAIDVYGEGKTWSDFAQVEEALGPYMSNRALLLERLQGAVAAANTIPNADPDRMGAMGYCFGGTCVLDIARDGGDDIRSVVSFHGGLAGNGLDNGPTRAKLLVLHGADDPMVPPEQVAEFQAEMTAMQVDWQFISYSNTVHAFTRPDANAPEIGAVYNPVTNERSWRAMLDFFSETL